MIHKECEKCLWLNIKDELCSGNIVDDQPMDVSNLRPTFNCGQKYKTEPSYTYMHKPNPKDYIYTKEEIDTIKSRIEELEEKTSDLSAEPISR